MCQEISILLLKPGVKNKKIFIISYGTLLRLMIRIMNLKIVKEKKIQLTDKTIEKVYDLNQYKNQPWVQKSLEYMTSAPIDIFFGNR